MRRYWFVFILIFILMGLGLAYYYLRSTTKTTQNTVALRSIPLELTENFDPTTNQPVFKVESADESQKILNLITIFPEQMAGYKVASLITCDNLNIEELFAEIQSGLNELTTFSGLCSNKSCAEINKGCDLIVNPMVNR